MSTVTIRLETDQIQYISEVCGLIQMKHRTDTILAQSQQLIPQSIDFIAMDQPFLVCVVPLHLRK